MPSEKVLVTGGAGFIGSHLVPALVSMGHEVRVLDNLFPQIHGALPQGLGWLEGNGIDFVRGSVCDRAVLTAALKGVDAVVHLAAETGTGQSMYEVSRYSEVNVGGTANLLDVLTNEPGLQVKRVVLASSRSIYGEGAYVCETCADGLRHAPDPRSPEELAAHRWEPVCPACGWALAAVPTRESDAVKPASIYAATKYAQEDLVRIGCSSLGIGYVILRLQNVYGEGQSLNNPYTGILSIFSTRVRRGLHLPIFEDGLETRDFVHVEDVANAFISGLTSAELANCVINVGSGERTTVLEIATHLSEAFGAPPDLKTTAQFRVGDIRHNCADIGRLKAILAYSPKVTLAEGMQRFASWVKTQDLPEDRLDKANEELRARKLMG